MCRRRVLKIDAGIADVSGGQTVSLHISGACPPSACAQRPDGRKVNRRSQTCLPKVRMCGRRLVCRDDGALLGEKNECHGAQDEPETHCCFHARRTNCGMNESDWVWQDVSSCYTLHTAADTNTNTDILMDFLVTVESRWRCGWLLQLRAVCVFLLFSAGSCRFCWFFLVCEHSPGQ